MRRDTMNVMSDFIEFVVAYWKVLFKNLLGRVKFTGGMLQNNRFLAAILSDAFQNMS